MLFIRNIFSQKPEIIKLATLRQDDFLRVSSLDFLAAHEGLKFRNSKHRAADFLENSVAILG